MPTFMYHGQEITIDTLYSYARVSSETQVIKQGGEGIPRQLEMHADFVREFNIKSDDLDGDRVLQFVDEAKSGSKGEHLKQGAGLAGFLEMARKGHLGPNPGLTVESFSRLGRMPIDRFNRLFWDIIERVTLITLADHRAYSQASLRRDKGQVYQIQAAMQAAASYAEDLAYYTTKSWKKRRGTPTALGPSWLDRFITIGNNPPTQVSGFKGAPVGALLEFRINPDKHAVIQDIFTDVLSMGVDRLCQSLNRRGVPTFAGAGSAWNAASVAGLIRGKMVLGEQRVGKYLNGRRTFTDETIQAYPPVVSRDQWMLANAELDRRKRAAPVNGRNATEMANLFGDLARCGACGGRMRIKQKQRAGRATRFRYFTCGNGLCTAEKKYHRLDQLEARLWAWFSGDPSWLLGGWSPQPVEDTATRLRQEIAVAQAESAKIKTGYERALLRPPGSLAEQMAVKLERDYEQAEQAIKLLERQLSAALTVKPMDAQIALVQGIAPTLARLAGDELVAARTQIARALATIFTSFVCGADGQTLIAKRANFSHPIPPLADDPDGYTEPLDPDDHLDDADRGRLTGGASDVAR